MEWPALIAGASGLWSKSKHTMLISEAFGRDRLYFTTSVLAMPFKRGAVHPYFVNVPPYWVKPHTLYPPFW